jgi:CRISPR/Cas system-associated exonuclease Cas4 (RecB family)
MSCVKLSASSIKSYKACPKQYWYRYKEKLPGLERDWFILGHFNHAVLEDFHNMYAERDTNTVADLSRLMKRSFTINRDKFKVTEEMLKNSKEWLTTYLHICEKKGMPDMVATELGFTFELDNPVDPSTPFLLRGSIDRLDKSPEPGYDYDIVDWKTTKTSSIKYMDDFQLGVYAVYVKRKYGAKNVRAGYQFLRNKSKIKWYEFDSDAIDEVEKLIQKDGKLIVTDTKWEKNVTKLCQYCDYAKYCIPGWEAIC